MSTRYEISLIIESDDDYSDGEQIESLRDDIDMAVADYNCFCKIGNTKIRELS